MFKKITFTLALSFPATITSAMESDYFSRAEDAFAASDLLVVNHIQDNTGVSLYCVTSENRNFASQEVLNSFHTEVDPVLGPLASIYFTDPLNGSNALAFDLDSDASGDWTDSLRTIVVRRLRSSVPGANAGIIFKYVSESGTAYCWQR